MIILFNRAKKWNILKIQGHFKDDFGGMGFQSYHQNLFLDIFSNHNRIDFQKIDWGGFGSQFVLRNCLDRSEISNWRNQFLGIVWGTLGV